MASPQVQPLPKEKFYPVELEFLAVDTICDYDIFIKYKNQYVFYRSAQLPFTQLEKNRLLASKNDIIYILGKNERELTRFYELNLSSIISNPKIPSTKKAWVLHQCATTITKDIFEKPENKETIARSQTVVNNTLELMSKDHLAFLHVISLSGHDYYTYTHCVNVMAFSIALLSNLGIKDSKLLKEAGMGALLHDVGKTKVPLTILNKSSPLSEEEWGIMKKHPLYGYELLDRTSVPEIGKKVVIQHHEKINGVGYPYGLKKDQFPLVSQVVSICDAYDAMTTNRCYQKALKPFHAFEIITQQLKDHFDLRVVEGFIHLLNVEGKTDLLTK